MNELSDGQVFMLAMIAALVTVSIALSFFGD